MNVHGNKMYASDRKRMKHGDALLMTKRKMQCVFWIKKDIKNTGFFGGRGLGRKKTLILS